MQKYLNLKNEIDMLKLRKKDILIENNSIDKLIKVKEQDSKEMEKYLKELQGVENKLYYQIVVKGLNVTKAVDRVSLETGLDPSTIWKRYYPNVKKIINSASESQVASVISYDRGENSERIIK